MTLLLRVSMFMRSFSPSPLADDSEMLRLMSEIEDCVSLLPAVAGSTNVQAEIALALQPLRSENAQLRRLVTGRRFCIYCKRARSVFSWSVLNGLFWHCYGVCVTALSVFSVQYFCIRRCVGKAR